MQAPRTVSRTFCKQCGTFIDEVPGEFHAQPKAPASKVLEATGSALNVINAVADQEAVADFSCDAVEAIIGAFNDRVLRAINADRSESERIMEDPESPWSEVAIRGASPTSVAIVATIFDYPSGVLR